MELTCARQGHELSVEAGEDTMVSGWIERGSTTERTRLTELDLREWISGHVRAELNWKGEKDMHQCQYRHSMSEGDAFSAYEVVKVEDNAKEY